MKYIFFLLILVNILFYLWETGVGRQAPKQSPKPQAPESIVLIQESQRTLSQTPPAEPAEQATTPPQAASSETPHASASPQTLGEPPATPNAVELSNPPLEKGGLGGISGEMNKHQTLKIPLNPPFTKGDAVNSTVLPATPPLPQTPGLAGEAAISPPPVDSAQGQNACQQLGPFASLKKAQAFQRKLKTSTGSFKPKKIPTEVDNGYLILYPAANSLQEAKANRTMLANKGFTDAWLIEEGENRYAISLAVTNDKQRADETVARYQSQGIAAELKTRKTLADKWWLEIIGAIDPAALLPAPKNPPDAGQALPGVKACE